MRIPNSLSRILNSIQSSNSGHIVIQNLLSPIGMVQEGVHGLGLQLKPFHLQVPHQIIQ